MMHHGNGDMENNI